MKSLIKYSSIIAFGTLAAVNISGCNSGGSSNSSSSIPGPSNSIAFSTSSVSVAATATIESEIVLPGITSIGVVRYGNTVLAGVDTLNFELQDSSGAVVDPTIATVNPTTCVLGNLISTCSIAINANVNETAAVQYQLVSTLTSTGDPLPPQAPGNIPVTITPAIAPGTVVPGTLSITPSSFNIVNPVLIRDIASTTLMVSLNNSQNVVAAPITITTSGSLAGANVVTNSCTALPTGLSTLFNVCTVTINPNNLDDGVSGQGTITVSSSGYQSVSATVNVTQH